MPVTLCVCQEQHTRARNRGLRRNLYHQKRHSRTVRKGCNGAVRNARVTDRPLTGRSAAFAKSQSQYEVITASDTAHVMRTPRSALGIVYAGYFDTRLDSRRHGPRDGRERDNVNEAVCEKELCIIKYAYLLTYVTTRTAHPRTTPHSDHTPHGLNCQPVMNSQHSCCTFIAEASFTAPFQILRSQLLV